MTASLYNEVIVPPSSPPQRVCIKLFSSPGVQVASSLILYPENSILNPKSRILESLHPQLLNPLIQNQNPWSFILVSRIHMIFQEYWSQGPNTVKKKPEYSPHYLSMPVQTPQWSEYLSCPVCQNEFEVRKQVSVNRDVKILEPFFKISNNFSPWTYQDVLM